MKAHQERDGAARIRMALTLAGWFLIGLACLMFWSLLWSLLNGN